MIQPGWHPRLLTLLLVTLFQPEGNAQTLRTLPGGEKIIVYADGSAVYFNDLEPVPGMEPGDSSGYVMLEVDIEPLEAALTPTEADLRRIAERRLNLAREALSLASTRVTAATDNRNSLEDRLADARSTGNLTEIDQLTRQVRIAERLEREAIRDEGTALQQIERTEAIIANGAYVEAYNEDRRQQRENLQVTPPANRQDRRLGLLLPQEAAFTGYGAATAREGIRETSPCRLGTAATASNGAQPLTPTLPLFAYTDPNLRDLLEGQEYLRGRAYTSRDAAGVNYLHLTYAFSKPSARNAYGTLPSGPNLSIHFLNGRNITLDGQRESVGIVNHQQLTLNYDMDYPLSRSQLAQLQREAIDYIRVFWAGGYEEYPIYRVDTIKNLCRCLQ